MQQDKLKQKQERLGVLQFGMYIFSKCILCGFAYLTG
jgi:hypothetical protein